MNPSLSLDRDKIYAVVSFRDEKNSLSIVPISWITVDDEDQNKYKTRWPPVKDNLKLNQYIIRCATPQDTWKKYRIYIKAQTRSYSKAKDKMSYLEDHTDIENSSSDAARKSKKENRKRKINDATGESVPVSECEIPIAQKCTSCEENELRFKKILDILIDIQFQTNSNASTIISLEEQMASKGTPVQNLNFSTWKQADNIDELRQLEEELQNKEEFEKKIHLLGIIGGKDLGDCVRKISSRLMSHETSLALNWTGSGSLKKTSLQEFPKVILLIHNSVRKNGKFKDASDAEINDILKKWLRSAFDRNGGRNERRLKTSQKTTDEMFDDLVLNT